MQKKINFLFIFLMHEKGKMNFNKIISEIILEDNDIKKGFRTEMENLLAAHDRCLIITDDKMFSYNSKLKFVDLLPIIKQTKKLVIHPSKFILLAWQGLLNVYEYEIIIINCEIKMDFIHAFRVFYIDNIPYDTLKPRCVLLIEKPKEEFSIYFQSMISKDYISKKMNSIKCYTIVPEMKEEYISYAKCKRLLIEKSKRSDHPGYKKLLETLDNLEKENINEALNLLNKCINPSKVENIQVKDEDINLCRQLLNHIHKIEKIKEYLQLGAVYITGDVDIKLPNVFNLDIAKVDENILENSTLIIMEDSSSKNLPNFKRIVFLKTGKEYSNLFIGNILKNEDLAKFHDYITRRGIEYYSVESVQYPTPTLPWEHSVIFFEHVLYMISRLFHDNFLYIRTLSANKSYHNGNVPNRYYCCIEFPKLVNNKIFSDTYKSDEFVLKKDTNKDVSYKFIIKLVESGYLDKNFLPVKQKFIDENTFYIENLKKVYDINFETIEEAIELINNIKDEYEDSEKFKRDFAFDLYQEDIPILDHEEVLRKQPDALTNFSDTMNIYIFNNSNIGICTGKSFKETVNYKNTEVRFLKEMTFTQDEKDIIFNFQVVFFGVNFKRVVPSQNIIRKYAYMVLPFKENEIDFEYMNLIYNNFFVGSVYDVKDRSILNNFLLFNPINKGFYEYVDETDKKLSDITTQVIKGRDKTRKNLPEEYTFLEYFRRLYGLNLTKFVDDTNIIISAIPYSTKKDKNPEFHAGEVLYVTTIKKSIKSDYKRFVEYFNIFETISLAQEFKENMNFTLSLTNLAISFTQRETLEGKNDLGYERFEFIGDSVLKYSVSKFLFTECGYNLNKLVSTKDSLICNNHLYKIGRKINLQKFFSFNKYSENLLQPPAILDEVNDKSLIKNLNVERVFLNNNQYNFVKDYSKRQAKDGDIDKGKKVYADIVESIIGVHYVEQGFENAWNFIKNVGILEDHGANKIQSDLSIENIIKSTPNIYLLCEYEGILPYNNIELIEKKINYKFLNKGYLEKAMIHPSYKNNIFGSERFQKLELVGDCFLDLKVSDYIYFKYTEADPEALHTHRKRLVNNHTFAMILFKSGLYDLALTGLNEQTRDITNNKISKCYSDIFESLAGAVVLDSEFDMKKTQAFFENALSFMIANFHDC